MLRWKALSALLFSLVMLASVPVYAARYVVNSTTASVDWQAAKWTTYPADPGQSSGIVPCTPLTAMQNAKAGDIVYFRGGQGGNYNLTMNDDYTVPALNPSNSGAGKKPITFENYPGETPYLRNLTAYPNDGWHNPLIGSNGKNWIIWEGFKLSAATDSGKVIFTDATNCTLRNTEVIGVPITSLDWGEGNYDGVRIERTKQVTIENCLIHGVDDTSPDGSDRGAAIKLYSAYNTIVEHCTFYDNDKAVFDKNDGQHNTYRLNFIQNNTPTPGSSAMLIGTNAGGPDTSYIYIYQNIILTAPGSGGIETTPTVHNLYVYNNVIYGGGQGYGLNITDTTNQRFWNNIIVNTSAAIRVADNSDGAPAYSNYNTFYNGQTFKVRDYLSDAAEYDSLVSWEGSGELVSGGNPDTRSIYADPQFVNPGGTSATDYQLKSTSPCRKLGLKGKDMGAWPAGNSVAVVGYMQPSKTQAPLAPTQLKTK